MEKSKHGLKILSIMTTCALENAIDTADSMKSRGYGLKGRTNFSNYRFDTRDRSMFTVLITLIVILLIGAFLGQNTIQFFPFIQRHLLNLLFFFIPLFYQFFNWCDSKLK